MARLEMIIGCMFSGKSSELIRRIRQLTLLGKGVLVINHTSDKRYGESLVVSHDRISVKAVAMEHLRDVTTMTELQECEAIFVDEGQFFHDLQPVVTDLVEHFGKTVIVSALDGTWERKPFQQVIDLIPFADDVVRLTAMCMLCRNGTAAPFSKRVVQSNNLELVGGIESYIPVCRKHYLEPGNL